LTKGEVVSAPGFALAPITGERDLKLGWVYLESPRSAEPKELRPFLLAMAKAVGALGEPLGARVPSVNRADANRAGILRILEENDWNIARVSRELGVTRRTLYMRLAAFGIARKKVPRLAKPLTA
jgi:DNA-binding NtrC family response regulator